MTDSPEIHELTELRAQVAALTGTVAFITKTRASWFNMRSEVAALCRAQAKEDGT